MYDIRLLCIVVKGSYTFYFHRKPTAEKGLYSFAHWLQMNHVSKQLWEKMKGKSIKGRMCLKSVGMIDTNITSPTLPGNKTTQILIQHVTRAPKTFLSWTSPAKLLLLAPHFSAWMTDKLIEILENNICWKKI